MPLLSRLFRRKPRDVCDFLCAGAHKAGTTWLWAALRQHPQVQKPIVKEIHYFDRLHIGVNYPANVDDLRATACAAAAAETGDAARRLQAIADGCDAPDDGWYRSIFAARGAQLSGEFSPEYLCLGLRGVEHIARLSPTCRVVIFVREPAARMVSALRMTMRRQPHLTPATAVDHWLFQERGNYSGHIPIWDHVFGRQMLYVPFGRIASAPAQVMADVERHIGLKPFARYDKLDHKFNSYAQFNEIPEFAMRKIERAAGRQNAYLTTRFGADFCAEI